ncbi:porin [Halomonas sp. PGE1]|uniref:porin n=1 Tax=Halomonas sp. PGE1 TaxID=2730360 RepID=UPI00147518B4|nr:porin [Halomonas sp. PGE1]QJQ99904.1 porin [Halomonas sp. PGE1]
MKKTLLATAIAGALGVSAAAQAATVYDQDGTRLDLYGRIALGVSGGGEEVNEDGEKINGSEFRDVYSRFGLRGTQRISDDLTAYGNFEVRPKMDEVNRDNQQVRNSFLGLRSNTFGSLQAGNFDSFYLNTVAAPFDVYIDQGLELTDGSHQARGDSLGYISPNLEGFQVYLMAKHYTGNTTSRTGNSGSGDLAGSEGSNSSNWNTAGGAVYEVDALRLALGYAQDRESTGGLGENIYGGSAVYEFVPGFSGRLAYEYQSDFEDKIGVGMTYAINEWAFNLDYYRIESQGDYKAAQQDAGLSTSRNSWAAGAYYKVSSNFDVFTELHESDQGTIIDSDTTGSDFTDNLRDVRDNVYWLVGARYHF